MLSMHARADYVEQALRAGAHGYVLKECAGEEVVAAVRAVHAGGATSARNSGAPARERPAKIRWSA